MDILWKLRTGLGAQLNDENSSRILVAVLRHVLS